MSASNDNAVPKVHPATREVLPDDPLEMHALQVPGDTELMTRLLIEEYARMGWGLESIMRLAHDPNYLAFHALLRLHGEDGLRSRIDNILSRTGVFRTTTTETDPDAGPHEPERLIQIEFTSPKSCR